MSSPPRPVVFAGYDPTSIDSMADILRRATGDRAIDTAALEVALVAVVHATGIGRQDTEAATLWYEGESDSHLEMGRQYMRVANAPNPLDPSVCTTALQPGLNGMIHNRWSSRWRKEGRGDYASIRNVRWKDLADQEQTEIREMARILSRFHKSMAPAHRHRKDELDTLLLLLAEVYADHTGHAGDHHELPHSAGSRFILFAREALKPFFDPSEVSAIALARRWQRQKKEFVDARSGPEDA